MSSMRVFAAERHATAWFGEADIRHQAKRVGEAGLIEVWPLPRPRRRDASEPWALPLPGASDSPVRCGWPRLVAWRIWPAGSAPAGADDPASTSPRARAGACGPGDVLVLVRRRRAFSPPWCAS
jgi:ATP-dependent helicase/nuclease subunit A